MILKRVERLLVSPRSALTLMGLFAAASAFLFLAPTPELAAAPWFLGLCLLSGLALGHTVWVQASRNIRRIGRGGRQSLGREARLWAAPAFHLGLLFLTAAGFICHGFQKRGFVQVMEGETIPGGEQDFLTLEKGPLAGTLELPFSLKLGAFTQSLWGNGEPRSFESALSVLRSGVAVPVEVGVNRPFSSSGFRVYQSPFFGPAVSLRLRKSSGDEAMTHFLLDRPSKPGLPAMGGSDFPTTDYDFKLAYRPVRETGGLPSPGASVFATVTRRMADPNGRAVVYRGPIPFDRPVFIGRDAVSVAAVRPWTGLVVVEDRSMTLAYLGFLLAALGASLMYILPRTEAGHA